jgi:hypothetical protein
LTAIAICAAAVLGGFWRVWFGGLLGSEITAETDGLTSGKTISRFAVLVFTGPAWFFWSLWQAAVLAVLLILYFSLDEVDFSSPLVAAWRYSLPLALLCASTSLWWGLPVALMPPISVALLRNRTVPAWWIFSGWTEWREAALGASSTGLIVAVQLLAPGLLRR